MAILEEYVEVKIGSRSLKYYRDLGYDAEMGKPLMVSVKDLMSGSRAEVTCICDECGKASKHQYSMYTLVTGRNDGKYYCKKCTNGSERVLKKIEETNMKKYGVPTTLLIPEIQENIKKANLIKFGVEYPLQNKNILEQTHKTIKDRYGVDNVLGLPEIREKGRQTSIKKYGVPIASQSPIVQEKIRQTNMKRYGVPVSTQNPKVIGKQQQTMIERYGAHNTMLVPELKEKVWQSSIEHYGTPNPIKSKEVLDKRTATNYERYGGPSPTSSPDVRRKQVVALQKSGSIATSKQQDYLHDLLGGTLNGVVGYYNCDIVFYDKKYILEFDGGAHDYTVKIGATTQEEFDQRQRKRFYVIKQTGFSQIRIISRRDKLPSDEVIQDIIKQSEQYFATTGHTWINWDIDSGCFYNYLNHDGIEYDFGPLRKIKDKATA